MGGSGWADPAGRGCEQLAAAGRGHQRGPTVLLLLLPGQGQAQMIPGRPYSVAAALESGRASWTAPLDAVRLGPEDDETEVTAARVRGVTERLIAAGRWREGDPPVLVVFGAGCDVTRLAWLLRDLPAERCGRLRSDRSGNFPLRRAHPGEGPAIAAPGLLAR